MELNSKQLSIALEAVSKASEKLKELFRGNLSVTLKPGHDPTQIVSEADMESETILRNILDKSFPNYGFFSEESEPYQIDAELIWIIDPLCGSYFYSRGLSQWSVSLALLQKKEVILSVISNPYDNEIFWALKNQGSFLNGQKIRVSDISNIENSIISISSRDLKPSSYLHNANKIIDKTIRLITMDNHWVLAQLAAGRIESVIRTEQPCYEIAAGSLLVSEAGGKFTDFNGGLLNIERNKLRSNNILASNGLIHNNLIDLLNTT